MDRNDRLLLGSLYFNKKDCGCAPCPDISEDEGNIIECRTDGIYATAESAPAARFAVSGEDDTAAENRSFNMDANYLEIGNVDNPYQYAYFKVDNSGNGAINLSVSDNDSIYNLIQLDTGGGQNYLDIYQDDNNGFGATYGWQEIYLTSNGVYIGTEGIAPNGTSRKFEVESNRITLHDMTGQDYNYIDIETNPNGDGSQTSMYIESINWNLYNNGNNYINFFGDDGSRPAIEIYSTGDGTDYIYQYIDGTQHYTDISPNSNMIIEGVDQDDTVTMIMGLDVNNNVRWRDVTTIAGGAALPILYEADAVIDAVTEFYGAKWLYLGDVDLDGIGSRIDISLNSQVIMIQTDGLPGSQIYLNGANVIAPTTFETTNLYIRDSATVLHNDQAGFTSYAAAQVATLGAASPVAGAPTKWLRIDDDGVFRYFPVW